MFRLKIILFIPMFLFQFCNNTENRIDHNYLDYISDKYLLEILVPIMKDGEKIEVLFSNEILFFDIYCKSKMNEIQYKEFIRNYNSDESIVDNSRIRLIKNEYKRYLNKLYLGEEKLDYININHLPHSIVYNTSIWKEYKVMGIDSIMKKYLKKTNKYYTILNVLSIEKENDLKRILFINSYLIGFDDAYGRDEFEKYR